MTMVYHPNNNSNAPENTEPRNKMGFITATASPPHRTLTSAGQVEVTRPLFQALLLIHPDGTFVLLVHTA